MSRTFFSGVGGSGMSGIALALAAWGEEAAGSDRNHDRGQSPELYAALVKKGIVLCPQDGSGITPEVKRLVVSTAIEETNPEVRRARELGIPVMRRAEMLAEIFNARRGIAVGGTSGKSTVTGMIAWILYRAGLDPTVINGGRMKNFLPEHFPGNARTGKGDFIVIEADESDGTIVNYRPEIAVITNVTKDHKPIEELVPLFQTFADHTSRQIAVNADCPIASELRIGDISVRFSIDAPSDIRPENVAPAGFGSTFRIGKTEFRLQVPGIHNVLNALAATAACRAAGVEDGAIAGALAEFTGIRRRFDIVGEANGVTVIDDFAHNPDKIRATLEASNVGRPRRLVYQPHGYGPTRFLKDELIASFVEGMKDDDVLYMTEIYYAGGTAEKTISGADLVEGIKAGGRNAVFQPDRGAIARDIAAKSRPGDLAIVMGARDDTLTDFCGEILAALRK